MTPNDLVEIERIKRLKYRYARLLDTKDWDGLAGCFVPDATASYSGGQLSFEGRDAIISFLRDTLGSTRMITSHVMTQAEIELVGSDRARGTWGLQDLVILADGDLEVRGAAFYEDEYVKVDGTWLFRHTGYRRVYEETRTRPDDAKLTATWWENEGRSQLVQG